MADEKLIQVPSGRDVWFQNFLNGAAGDGLTFHFRFVVPDLGVDGDLDPEETETDMAHLCDSFALPRISNIGPRPNRVVISMADRETEFGVANPEVTQVFESYSLSDATCIWEPF